MKRLGILVLAGLLLPFAAQAQTSAAPEAAAPLVCELHVFPTRNYIAISTGWMVGLGAVGALADNAMHKVKVKTVKDLLAEGLTPEAQIEQLNKVAILATLKLPADTRVVVEPAYPTPDEVKADPALKAKMQAVQADIKAGKRQTTSTATCYAELLTTHIFYQKAALYGTRLFTGWMFRDFKNKPLVVTTSEGQVQNAATGFPAESADKEQAGKDTLRGAFAKDFTKWASEKLKP